MGRKEWMSKGSIIRSSGVGGKGEGGLPKTSRSCRLGLAFCESDMSNDLVAEKKKMERYPSAQPRQLFC